MVTANNNVKKPAKQNNAETVIQQHLTEMEKFGRDAKVGSTAKQNAIELFQKDCLDGIANVGMVTRYVDAYCKGAAISGNAKKTFQSALTAFGDPNVIKAWPTFSAALTKLHDAKDKSVNRETTGKDKFAQLYKIATKIKDTNGAVPAITEAWVKSAVAKVEKSKDDLAKIARKAIHDSMESILPAKPTKAQTEAAVEFFKAFGIELPGRLKTKV